MTIPIRRTGDFNGPLLTEEIVAGIPELIDRGKDPPVALFTVQVAGQNLLVRVPGGTNEALLNAIIDAHDPNALSKSEALELRYQSALKGSIRDKLGLHLRLTEEEIDTLPRFLADLQ